MDNCWVFIGFVFRDFSFRVIGSIISIFGEVVCVGGEGVWVFFLFGLSKGVIFGRSVKVFSFF